VSHPEGLPDLFLDRSLGRKIVPELLRADGLRLVTLSEHYGIPDDEEWLEFAGTSGKAVLMKDTLIRYNRAEREAVKRHGVRCFCLTRQDLTCPEMAARFIANLDAITRARAAPARQRRAARHEPRLHRRRRRLPRSNFRRRVWLPATEAVGVPGFRFHDLRHTGATLAAATGAPLRAVMSRMGHSTPAAALRYQHRVAGQDLAIAAAIDATVGQTRRTESASGENSLSR
jgi:PIN like domain/Phage integrase family